MVFWISERIDRERCLSVRSRPWRFAVVNECGLLTVQVGPVLLEWSW